MKQRLQKFYRYSLCGALGGFIASCIHQLLFLDTLSEPLEASGRYKILAMLGCAVGASIGFFPSFIEGRANYSLKGAFRSGLIGAALGCVGGAVALPLAEWIHLQLGGGFKGRMVALAILGFSIGIAEALNGGARFWRGVAGGITGGLLAGLTLELLLPVEFMRSQLGVVALVLIGLSIASFIALFVNVLQDAWLEGQEGSKVSGQAYSLGKFREPAEAYLGSDQNGAVYIWIPDAQPRHASITLTAHGARLRHRAPTGDTLVGGTPVRERILRDGEIIEIGHSKLKYRERQRTALTRTAAIKLKSNGA
ncbi:MAG TPA: hypothetical protein VGB05_11210 [Pyrinomonadaceae bacterium]